MPQKALKARAGGSWASLMVKGWSHPRDQGAVARAGAARGGRAAWTPVTMTSRWILIRTARRNRSTPNLLRKPRRLGRATSGDLAPCAHPRARRRKGARAHRVAPADLVAWRRRAPTATARMKTALLLRKARRSPK